MWVVFVGECIWQINCIWEWFCFHEWWAFIWTKRHNGSCCLGICMYLCMEVYHWILNIIDLWEHLGAVWRLVQHVVLFVRSFEAKTRRKSGLPTDAAYFHSPTCPKLKSQMHKGSMEQQANKQSSARYFCNLVLIWDPTIYTILILQAAEASTISALGVFLGCCCVHVWQKDSKAACVVLPLGIVASTWLWMVHRGGWQRPGFMLAWWKTWKLFKRSATLQTCCATL